MKEPSTGFLVLNGVQVRDPYAMTWGLSDVSAKDAGRDEGATMHKMRVAQKRQYTITWSGISPDAASRILRAVNEKEYFVCRLFDPMDNDYVERTYYVGDRSAQFKLWIEGEKDGKVYGQVSFTLIER